VTKYRFLKMLWHILLAQLSGPRAVSSETRAVYPQLTSEAFIEPPFHVSGHAVLFVSREGRDRATECETYISMKDCRPHQS
jgi:hypothetical protein